MPTYEYLCRNCGFHLEEFQSMSEAPLTRCPSCGKESLARGIGGGAGLIFKGSGFYLTDYNKGSAPGAGVRKEEKKEGKKEEKKEEKPKGPTDTGQA